MDAGGRATHGAVAEVRTPILELIKIVGNHFVHPNLRTVKQVLTGPAVLCGFKMVYHHRKHQVHFFGLRFYSHLLIMLPVHLRNYQVYFLVQACLRDFEAI